MGLPNRVQTIDAALGLTMLPALQSPKLKTNTTGNKTAAMRTVAKECANFVILFLEMMLEAKIARYCICSHVHQSCQHLLSTVL